jgi:hypothetical protein
MPIWLYILAGVMVGSIVAVNVWLRTLSAEERKRIEAETQDDMRNFSM